jgi:hypothetical protein
MVERLTLYSAATAATFSPERSLRSTWLRNVAVSPLGMGPPGVRKA